MGGEAVVPASFPPNGPTLVRPERTRVADSHDVMPSSLPLTARTWDVPQGARDEHQRPGPETGDP
jgi:hypothetical protein